MFHSDNILLPPFHIKIGLMKYFALSKNEIFMFFYHSFPSSFEGKFHADTFTEPETRQHIFDTKFNSARLTRNEKFQRSFSVNNNVPNYKEIVRNAVTNFCVVNASQYRRKRGPACGHICRNYSHLGFLH